MLLDQRVRILRRLLEAGLGFRELGLVLTQQLSALVGNAGKLELAIVKDFVVLGNRPASCAASSKSWLARSRSPASLGGDTSVGQRQGEEPSIPGGEVGLRIGIRARLEQTHGLIGGLVGTVQLVFQNENLGEIDQDLGLRAAVIQGKDRQGRQLLGMTDCRGKSVSASIVRPFMWLSSPRSLQASTSHRR